jgi:hypothetical protein
MPTRRSEGVVASRRAWGSKAVARQPGGEQRAKQWSGFAGANGRSGAGGAGGHSVGFATDLSGMANSGPLVVECRCVVGGLKGCRW